MANETTKKKLDAEEWRKLTKVGAKLRANIYPTGISMRPLIRGGKDRVIVEPFAREIMRGDIVLFLRKDGAQVLHRVWKIEANAAQSSTSDLGTTRIITTFGDGCWWPDQSITEDKVLGLATRLYRGGAKNQDKTQAQAALSQTQTSKTLGQSSPDAKYINLDTKACRKIGLIWLSLGPIRRLWYRIRNRMNWIKRQLKKVLKIS